MANIETLLSLEQQLLHRDLSPNEYFAIAISSCEEDLELAKRVIKNVLRKLQENYTSSQEKMYSTLQNLYDDFFQVSFSNEKTTSDSSSNSEIVRHVNGLTIESQITNTQINHTNYTTKKKKKKNNKKNKKSKSCDTTSPVILWFRRDLRIYDNPALIKAAFNETGEERPVIPVFIWDEEEEKERYTNGGAVKVWLKRALDELDKSLTTLYGSRLILRRCNGSLEQEIMSLVRETGAKTVVWTALYEPWILERDAKIRYRLNGIGVNVHIEHSYLLHRPDEVIVPDTAKGIGSVVHFMECCRESVGSRTSIGVPVDRPQNLKSPSTWPSSCSLEEMKLYVKPKRRDGTFVDWAKQINAPDCWKFGENGGYNQLSHFLEEDVVHYEKESSRADMPWTSVISPYLHWGEISPRTVLYEALSRGQDAAKFRRKLAW